MSAVGLVLSGGGARGAAHIVALQALNDNGIYPDAISASSAGALIGSLYCYGYSPKEILTISKTETFIDLFKMKVFTKDWNRLKKLERLLQTYIHNDNFESLQIPLYVCVTNLNKGVAQYIENGELIKYVIASCAIPLIFKSVIIGNETFVDGGLLNNLPIEPLQDIAMKIIGISICPHMEMDKVEGIKAICECIFRLNVWNNVGPRLGKCDVGIEIEESFTYGMFNVHKSDELFQVGYDTVTKQIDDIKRKLFI